MWDVVKILLILSWVERVFFSSPKNREWTVENQKEISWLAHEITVDNTGLYVIMKAEIIK